MVGSLRAKKQQLTTIVATITRSNHGFATSRYAASSSRRLHMIPRARQYPETARAGPWVGLANFLVHSVRQASSWLVSSARARCCISCTDVAQVQLQAGRFIRSREPGTKPPPPLKLLYFLYLSGSPLRGCQLWALVLLLSGDRHSGGFKGVPHLIRCFRAGFDVLGTIQLM